MKYRELMEIVSENCHVCGSCISGDTEIDDVAFYNESEAPYSERVLYFIFSEQLPELNGAIPKLAVICDEPQKESGKLPESLFISRSDLGSFFNTVRKTLDKSKKKDYYEDVMRQLKEAGDIPTVIDTSALFFGGSLILCDPDFRILAYSVSIPVSDHLWKGNIKKGFCDYDFIKEVRAMDSTRLMRFSSQTVEVTCAKSPLRKYASSILYKGKMLGFLLLIENESSSGVRNTDLLSTLSGIFSFWIPQHAAEYLPRQGVYHEALYQLLIGNSHAVADGMKFPSVMSLCFVRMQETDRALSETALQEQLNMLNPYIYSVHHSGGFVILADEEALNGEKLLEICKKICRKNTQIHIGISNPFSDITKTREAFLQAQKAIELGQTASPGKLIFRYEDYNLTDFLGFADKEDLGRLIHPAINRIKNHFPDGKMLLDTLSVYLRTGESIKETADVLYMHRNSIQYRLKRISEIGKVDLDEPETRFRLRLSLAVVEQLCRSIQ